MEASSPSVLAGNSEKVSPENFGEFLKWAYVQYQLPKEIVINKVVQEFTHGVTDNKKDKAKLKNEKRSDNVESTDMSMSPTNKGQQYWKETDSYIQITMLVDSNDHLVEIFLENNPTIPRKLIIIIALIAKFHPHFESIKINKGLDGYVMYELNKLLACSNIVYVCLDGTTLRTEDYHTVLMHSAKIKHLSLKHCGITDEAVKKITQFLYYPLEASRNLLALNLTSNHITDAGAKHIATSLRSNRTLTYLNLSDNKIGDEGGAAILEVLSDFILTYDEVFASRTRFVKFLKKKNDLILKNLAEMRAANKNMMMQRRKPRPPTKGKVLEKEGSLKSYAQHFKMEKMDPDFERATQLAELTLGTFTDPFLGKNIKVSNDVVYCLGNNTVMCLNLAYNNLSYNFLVQLHQTLLYQKVFRHQNSKGLLNVIFEGNNMPNSCIELVQINELIQSGLNNILVKPKGKPGTAVKK